MQQNLEYKSITLAFLAALIPTLFFPSCFSNVPLTFFAPFLAIVYYQKSYLVSLWASLLCGFILDLLAVNTQMGLHAIGYCLTTALLYKQRRHFFADSISTLPLMTFFFASLSTVWQLVLMYTLRQDIPLYWDWIITDLIYMPALDALYAFCCFNLLAISFGRRQRRGKEYFLS